MIPLTSSSSDSCQNVLGVAEVLPDRRTTEPEREALKLRSNLGNQ